MTTNRKHQVLTWLFALVWFINGVFCKVLNLVPRHQQIVSRILGDEHARLFTIIIGLLEAVMAIWVITGFKSKLNAIIQILVISIMNTLEVIIAPDLLLWGKWNAFFAFLFLILIFYNEFNLNKK